jgi:hypothetical protein
MISLGGNCSITYQLNKYKFREKAYPFDWCKISINQLINVLEYNFNNYIDSITINKYSENHESYLVSNIYNVQYAHEVIDTNLDKFKESLYNRIERFQNLDNVTFIRIELDIVNENEYIVKIEKLIKLLSKYANNFIIKLVLKNKVNFNNNRVKIYYYNEFIDWQMNNVDWNKIII